VLVDHEAAADRVVVLGGEHHAGGVVRGEAHAVGVVRQLLALVHHQVVLLVEGDLVLATVADALAAADALQRGRDEVGVDLVRPVALQAHQHRLVGAVAAPGHRQRAEDLGAHPRDPAEGAGVAQPLGHEARGRAHRSDGVRGTRADADLEQVEGADCHPAILCGWPTVTCFSSATTATCATWRWRSWPRRARRTSAASSSTTIRRSRSATGYACRCSGTRPAGASWTGRSPLSSSAPSCRSGAPAAIPGLGARAAPTSDPGAPAC